VQGRIARLGAPCQVECLAQGLIHPGVQLQGLPGGDPVVPQTRALLAPCPPLLGRRHGCLAREGQSPQAGGQVLQTVECLAKLGVPGGLIVCGRVRLTHDLGQGEFGTCHLLPHVCQRWESDRGGTQGAADPGPVGGNAMPQRLLLRKAEEGKTAHLAKIVGDQVLSRRRRVALHCRVGLVGLLPRVVILDEVPREQCVRWQLLCQRCVVIRKRHRLLPPNPHGLLARCWIMS
jgi:hypothetical protein